MKNDPSFSILAAIILAGVILSCFSGTPASAIAGGPEPVHGAATLMDVTPAARV
jgi:hypothetical protein